MKADYTSDEEEDDDEGSDIERNRAKRLEKAKAALRDSDEESEKSKRSSRLPYFLLCHSRTTNDSCCNAMFLICLGVQNLLFVDTACGLVDGDNLGGNSQNFLGKFI